MKLDLYYITLFSYLTIYVAHRPCTILYCWYFFIGQMVTHSINSVALSTWVIPFRLVGHSIKIDGILALPIGRKDPKVLLKFRALLIFIKHSKNVGLYGPSRPFGGAILHTLNQIIVINPCVFDTGGVSSGRRPTTLWYDNLYRWSAALFQSGVHGIQYCVEEIVVSNTPRDSDPTIRL